jgi:hypothetical protein
MRARITGVRLFVGIGAATLALALGLPGSGDEPKRSDDKAPGLTLDEKYGKLKGGILKLREADVIALLGPAHSMTRPGQQDKADIELRWQYATRIVVTFKGGKVREVWGTFSEQLPVAKITPENFRKVQPGLTEKEVAAILGDVYAIVTKDGIETGEWGGEDDIKFGFAKDGFMVSHDRPGNSFAPRKKQ